MGLYPMGYDMIIQFYVWFAILEMGLYGDYPERPKLLNGGGFKLDWTILNIIIVDSTIYFSLSYIEPNKR